MDSCALTNTFILINFLAPNMTKKIIHVDMDCFYAQVEMLDRPELKTLPLAIGGPPHSRSVLCTSNYEARKYGVRSAMPSDTAMPLISSGEVS